ncbi:MAG: hypothetical protein B6I25_08240 [Planctomycetales bacterium 4572_13]|nr:MAG: hypothetical protein B6I25_08240 [Planctomycetales bacterium 4572_13]
MKKFTLFTLMMVISIFTSTTQAAYRVNPFVVCEATGDQQRPDIDGDIVVWQDSDTDIYWKQIDSPNGPNVIDSGGSQTYPAISGNKVVWRDDRGTSPNNQRDIYSFDLLSQTLLTEPNMPFEDGILQQDPDVSGNLTVYRHDGSNKTIYIYDSDPNTNQVVSAASTDQYEPAIDGTIVVWMENVGPPQVFVRDVSTTDLALRISPTSNWQRNPAISGRVIVWDEDSGDGTYNIYGYDLDDPETGTFSICTAAGDQKYPAISGNIVAWQNAVDDNIWAIDLDDMAEGCFVVSDGTGDNQLPAVFADTLSDKKTIVWQRHYDGYWDIWATELRDPSTVTVIDPNGGEWFLAGSGVVDVNWTTTGPVDEVLIEFSSDGKVTWTDVNTVENTGNTGSYPWPIADVNSADCWIRVTNTADGEATDTSNAAFEIYQIPDSITVTYPNGGEQFLAGSEVVDVNWTYVGDFDAVKIEFSDSNGANWEEVIASTPNTGSYLWDSNEVTDSNQCLIHISDAANSSTWDKSDSRFTFFQCDTALTADLTGDCFVGIADFAEFAYQWLLCGNPHNDDWCFE